MSGKTDLKQLGLFLEHLSSLARMELPLSEGLRKAAAEAGERGFQRLCDDAAAGLERGLPLSEALAEAGPAVPKLVVAMIRAGERTGNLVRPVERLEAYYHASAMLSARLRSATLYPAITLGVAFFFLPVYGFAIGEFRRVFASMNVELPAMTRLTLDSGPIFSALFALLLVTGTVALLGRSEAIERLFSKLPGVGRMLMLARTARTSRLLAMLLENGVPVPDALDLAAEAADEKRAGRALRWLSASVTDGNPMSESLMNVKGPARGVFPLTFAWTVGAGERSGELERVLLEMASYNEEEVEHLAHSIPIALEAGLLGVVGVLAFLMILSLFLPMLKIVNHVG
jgi:type IV pilus assembly protein PilC